MKTTSKKVLEALTKSSNPTTARSARFILAGEKMVLGGTPREMDKLAAAGILGGFLQAVMSGDLHEMWVLADELNQEAIKDLVPEELKGY